MNDLFSALDYPNVAGSKRVGTSEQAAREITPTLTVAHEQMLIAYRARGPMTADQACKACDWSLFYGRPRNSELVAMGKLIDTGTRRKSENNRSATVWDIPRAAVLGVGR